MSGPVSRRGVRGILFDLDGVLLSTDRYHAAAWQALADRLDIPLPDALLRQFRGVGRAQCLEWLLSCDPTDWVYTEAERSELSDWKNEQYRAALRELTPQAVDGHLRSCLKTLRERGYRLAVASSSRNAGLILTRTALTDAFDAVVDGRQITRSKPDPEVFLRAAAALRLEKSACAVVEDAPAGIRAAKAAGMLAVAVPVPLDGADLWIKRTAEVERLFS